MCNIKKVLCSVAVMSAVVAVVSCSGNIHETQAEIYEEYKSRLDTATTYVGLKLVNDALETEITNLFKSRGADYLNVYKQSNKYRDSEKRLAKAEAEYMASYFNKFFTKNLQEQIDLCADYTSKLESAVTYDELSALCRSLNSAFADATSKYAAEFKKAGQKKIMPEKFAELDKAKESFFATYASKVAPLLHGHESAIYEKYLLKLNEVSDFKSIKQVKLYLDKEIAIFNNENEVVYRKMSQNELSALKAHSAAARDRFMEYYLDKVALPLVAYQKQIYSGATEMLAAARNADEMRLVSDSFQELNNAFVQENSEELGWVERTVLAGDKVCGKANDELNECLGRFIEVSKKKAQELGLQ